MEGNCGTSLHTLPGRRRRLRSVSDMLPELVDRIRWKASSRRRNTIHDMYRLRANKLSSWTYRRTTTVFRYISVKIYRFSIV